MECIVYKHGFYIKGKAKEVLWYLKELAGQYVNIKEVIESKLLD